MKYVQKLKESFRLINWLKNYGKFELMCDLTTGLSLSLSLIPESIAYATLMELTPKYGLNSTFAGCILYVLFGTVKEVIIGPAAVLCITTFIYTSDLNGDFAILLTLLVGIIEMLMGLFKLGFLVNYISLPVSCGYVTALAIVIASSQLKGFFGLKYKSKTFLENWRKLIENIKYIKHGDIIVGVVCIIVLIIFKVLALIKFSTDRKLNVIIGKCFWFLSIARNAIVVISAISIAMYLKNDRGSIPFEITGDVEEGLPPIKLPLTSTTVDGRHFTFIEMVQELNYALIGVPIMSIATNIAIAKVYNRGKLIEANNELFALGLCNALSSFVGSIPVCGAIGRSSIAQASNIQTPFAGVFCGIFSLMALWIFTPYFNLIPKATLSAVLITSVVFMIEFPVMLPMWKINKKDLFIMITTIILSLVLGLANGFIISTILSILPLVYTWSRPDSTITLCKTSSGHNYIEITPHKNLYFPTVTNVCNLILQQNKETLVVIDCKQFNRFDFTAMKELYVFVMDLNEQGRKIMLKNANLKIQNKWRIINKNKSYLIVSDTDFDLDALYFEKNIQLQNEHRELTEDIKYNGQ